MDPFCKYKNAFGAPHQGFHSSRIGPFAAGDTLVTIIAALILTFLWNPGCATKEERMAYFILCLIFLVFLGEIFHLVFCVKTEGIVKLQALFEGRQQSSPVFFASEWRASDSRACSDT